MNAVPIRTAVVTILWRTKTASWLIPHLLQQTPLQGPLLATVVHQCPRRDIVPNYCSQLEQSRDVFTFILIHYSTYHSSLGNKHLHINHQLKRRHLPPPLPSHRHQIPTPLTNPEDMHSSLFSMPISASRFTNVDRLMLSTRRASGGY
jgi:hypothetical protein